ncbi:phosphonate utilization transcriptional regulator PhnR [Hahella sp. CCB-MM4]|uniref:phosphonate utilization transcriptional regulator PhnR n=1 Tax=Hahella sp. (strain CCB-MM4) TaxID=1926491 RepID=UPI000B9BB825|nr:phosphonate utilization transcriptional regulator PhnR [Hahella sp. CCB-MM4]OZG70950.1 phosphonate utilization transcriptional regulator PhnR [Hahella sp. CCB-MM4]
MTTNSLPTDGNANHYRHLEQHFRYLINQEALLPGDKLPSEREIGEQFRLTRITVRQALQTLEAQGLIYRQNRRGWFVSPPAVIYKPAQRKSFVEYVSKQGLHPQTELISQELIAADQQLSKQMQTSKGTPLLKLHRRRSIEGRPVLIEHMILNVNLLSGIEKEDLSQSLTRMLPRFGQTYHAMDLTFKSTALPTSAATDLGIAAGLPGLQIERINYNESGEIIEIDYEYWRHDAVIIQVGIHGQ